jgi:hypothetical protein
VTPDAPRGDEAPRQTLREGRYVLLTPLGQGSQGTTWDAVDKREGRPVAIKAFDVRGARAWKDVELAEREARVLAELRHPLLPRYIEHFEEDGVLYLVMEKVHGTPLSVLQKSGRRPNEQDLLRFLRDADQVLTYLHAQSPAVIHRDLKPSNVIRRPDGSHAFVDFGAVRDRLRPEGGSTVVGTFGYMAPEQFQGRAGPGSDVYAIGATAVALVTGLEPEKLPHRGLSLDVDAAVGSAVSPRLREALKRMLEPDPDQRPTRIGPLLAGGPPPRPDPREALPRSAREHREHARHVARSVAKQERGDWRRARRRHLPFLLQLVIGLTLLVARIAVTLVLRVTVPLLLTLLAIVFGEPFKRAAHDVATTGARLGDALRGARDQMERGWGPEDEARVRAPGPSTRSRVAPPEPRVRYEARGESEDDGAAREDEDEASARRHRRTRL